MSKEFDLTKKMAPFLDIHMLFDILDWISDVEMYPRNEILETQMSLASKTSMIMYELEIHNKLKGIDDESAPLPAYLEAKKDKCIEKNTELAEICKPLLAIKDDVEKIKQLQKKGSLVVEEGKIDVSTLDKLYEYTRFGMDMGQYEFVKNHLVLFRLCIADRQKSLDALWGQLAASILDDDVDGSYECWKMLKHNIDKTKADGRAHLVLLQQRTFLLHWGLFVLFNMPEPEELDAKAPKLDPKTPRLRWAREFSELFFPQQSGGNRASRDDSTYMTVVRINCPWMLRYIAAAVILQRQCGSKDTRQNLWRQGRRLADFVKLLHDDSSEYSDPITKFLQFLYYDHDLIGAKNTLAELESVLKSDYFLFQIHGKLYDEDQPENFVQLFVKCAREMWLETFCDIHHKIDLQMLSTQLKLDIADAEEWMVDLIVHRDSEGSDPKIDKEAGQIIMGKKFPSIYQTVVNTSRDLLRRSQEMQNSVVSAYNKPH